MRNLLKLSKEDCKALNLECGSALYWSMLEAVRSSSMEVFKTRIDPMADMIWCWLLSGFEWEIDLGKFKRSLPTNVSMILQQTNLFCKKIVSFLHTLVRQQQKIGNYLPDLMSYFLLPSCLLVIQFTSLKPETGGGCYFTCIPWV